LKLTTAASQNFVARMQAQGIKVVPFISNHWDRAQGQAALLNREELTDRLADEIIRYNLDGINIDLENLTPADRFAYVDFVRLLRQKLPAGSSFRLRWLQILTRRFGQQGFYDSAGLASYFDNHIIMAYDEHYQNGRPGGFSMAFVNRSIQYGPVFVPKKKSYWPSLYGVTWQNGGGYLWLRHKHITADALIETYGFCDQGSVQPDIQRNHYDSLF
jgi:spore germination protein YaaH